MATQLLPSPEAFGVLAGSLVGKKVKVVKGAALTNANVRAVATYVDSTGTIKFVALTDIALLAGMGAALVMIPLPVVESAIRTSKLGEPLYENAYEFLNVAASLFNEVEGTTMHVKVTRLEVGAMTPQLSAQVAKAIARLDLAVTVTGYPEGKISLVAVP